MLNRNILFIITFISIISSCTTAEVSMRSFGLDPEAREVSTYKRSPDLNPGGADYSQAVTANQKKTAPSELFNTQYSDAYEQFKVGNSGKNLRRPSLNKKKIKEAQPKHEDIPHTIDVTQIDKMVEESLKNKKIKSDQKDSKEPKQLTQPEKKVPSSQKNKQEKPNKDTKKLSQPNTAPESKEANKATPQLIAPATQEIKSSNQKPTSPAAKGATNTTQQPAAPAAKGATDTTKQPAAPANNNPPQMAEPPIPMAIPQIPQAPSPAAKGATGTTKQPATPANNNSPQMAEPPIPMAIPQIPQAPSPAAKGATGTTKQPAAPANNNSPQMAEPPIPIAIPQIPQAPSPADSNVKQIPFPPLPQNDNMPQINKSPASPGINTTPQQSKINKVNERKKEFIKKISSGKSALLDDNDNYYSMPNIASLFTTAKQVFEQNQITNPSNRLLKPPFHAKENVDVKQPINNTKTSQFAQGSQNQNKLIFNGSAFTPQTKKPAAFIHTKFTTEEKEPVFRGEVMVKFVKNIKKVFGYE